MAAAPRTAGLRDPGGDVGLASGASGVPAASSPSDRSRPSGRRAASSTRARFQPEIQALRALAVLAVMAYHFRPGALPGGYVGVDIFFVISGYLITGLMIREIAREGRLSFRGFYGRRIRRILPAASAALAAITVAGVLILPMNRWTDLGHEALATTFFGQNWYLAHQSVDYLAEGAAASPLQHYWSLSVEEQFYFVWPALLVASIAAATWWRRRRGHGPASPRLVAGVVLWAVVAGSGAYSALQVIAGDPAAYFVTPARAWELALGGLVAVHWPQLQRLARGPRRGGAWLGSGTALVAFALVTYDAATPFPGVAALAPTVGTAAMILGANRWIEARPDGALAHLIGARSVQWCGDASYSLYLWHWPVVVFLPYLFPGVSPAVALGFGVALAFLLGALSRHLVELPFLHHTSANTALPRLVAVAAVSMSFTAIAGAGTVGWFHHSSTTLQSEAQALESNPPRGFGSESISRSGYRPFVQNAAGIAPTPSRAREDLPESAKDDCKSSIDDPTTPRCVFGDEDAGTTVVLVGDSHTEQYLPAFQKIAEEQSLRIVTYLHASCPFSFAQRESDATRGGPCLEANRATLADIVDRDEADLFVTSNLTDHPFVESADVPSPTDGFRQMWKDLRAVAPVAVLSDNPMMLPKDETTECVLENLNDPEDCAIDKDDAMPLDRQRAAAAGDPDVTWVDMTGQYCTADECPPVIGNVMVYRDQQHVTETYARTLADYVWGQVEPLLGTGAAAG
ncbi:acyltransferase family protein [Pseudactinotalea sp. HY160]|uniref:acyltransferase family protein n=1 Tax=Pseudactinotalea sp. HY160 TaxID=2654490 RepID=UPI00128D4B1D|nr:acyltransferase family protein [Pseudactinotalea sp. HY160]